MKLLNNCVIEYCPECIHFGVLDDEMETTFCKLFAEFTKVPMGRIHPNCPLSDCEVIEDVKPSIRGEIKAFIDSLTEKEEKKKIESLDFKYPIFNDSIVYGETISTIKKKIDEIIDWINNR